MIDKRTTRLARRRAWLDDFMKNDFYVFYYVTCTSRMIHRDFSRR